uniref:Uncharacterized protein n=1 Tax=Rhizophora mucronata TaxID=61149 RepID=A0A2P2PWB9_RHIMU
MILTHAKKVYTQLNCQII